MKVHRYSLNTLYILLGIILLLAPLYGCATEKQDVPAETVTLPPLVTYIDEINGFEVSYPQQWSRMPDSPVGGALVSFGDNGGQSTGPSVTVSNVPPDTNNLHTASTPCDTFTIISQQEWAQDYKPAQKYIYTAQCGTTSLKAIQLYLTHDNTRWSVTCTGTPEQFDEMRGLFDALISSFSLRSVNTIAARPKINSFTTSADIVERGQPALLSWEVSDADTVSLHPSLDSAGITGTLQVSPSTSTTYTLVAGNSAGISTKSLTVGVTNGSNTIGYDPVTGRNADISFEWEQYCLATGYQLQIANDPGFTRMVYDSGSFNPDSTTSPAMLYRAGGILQAGHTYYWRVRITETATGQKLNQSAWSRTQTFNISPGAPVATQYYGMQGIKPENNCGCVPVDGAAFAWSPCQDTDKYKFTLARDSGMKDIITVAEVDTPAFLYDGILDYNTGYFWKVSAFSPVQSESSATFSFTTEPAPQSIAVPANIQASAEPAPAMPVDKTPTWAWMITAIGCVLIIVVVVLLFRVRKNSPVND